MERIQEVDTVDDFAANVVTIGDLEVADEGVNLKIEDELLLIEDAPFGLPPVVGWWTLHNGPSHVIFQMYSKPRWLTRLMAGIFFELVWEDAK